jgi:phage terminase small subunit
MTSTIDNKHNLTDLELRFCNEYAVDLNGTHAVKRAGFKYKSENAAAKRASDTLRKPHIRAYLAEILELTSVSVISEISRIAHAQITDVCSFTSDGISIKKSDELSDRAKSALKSVKMTERYDAEGGRTVTVEVRMHDKLAALDKLMKKLRLYPSQMDILEALRILAADGLLVPGQVQALESGLEQIKTNMHVLADSTTRLGDHAPAEES